MWHYYRGDVIEPGSAVINISSQESKTLDVLDNKTFDYVVTVCGNAKETCPVFPARIKLVHRGFDDTRMLVKEAANEAEALSHDRRVRDEIMNYILSLPMALDAE